MNIPENEKVIVRKDNRELHLSWREAERYLRMGYTVYNLAGEIIVEPDTDKSKLRAAQKEIARLTAELEAAQNEIARLTQKLNEVEGKSRE